MNKKTIRIFMVLLLMTSIPQLLISQAEADGATYCSMKKQHNHNLLERDPLGPNSPRHSYDVQKYTLTLDFLDNFDSPFTQVFDGQAVVEFKVDSSLNSIVLNAVQLSLLITQVSGAGISFDHVNNLLTVQLDRTYSPGETASITIDYQHLEVEDGAFFVSGGYLFTDCEPQGARKWFPCYDSPSDKASLEVFALVPDDVMLGSNGTLVDSIVDAGTLEYHWLSEIPIATYLMVITAKKGYHRSTLYWTRPSDGASVPFVYYYGADTPGIGAMAKVNNMAYYFSNKYGEYPFTKSGFATANDEFVWGGMENQTLTTLCYGCWNESLMVHEFAHQWFGDMISPGTWADLWLNEGFATWSEALWLEPNNYTNYKNRILNYAGTYLSQNPGWAIYNESWIDNPPNNGVMFNYSITYAKSACVLHQLRYLLGDEVYFEAIKSYAEDTVNFKFKTAVTDDFATKIGEVAGEDLHWYFDAWVKQPNHPVYFNEFYFTEGQPGSWQAHFLTSQVQTDAPFFPMDLEVMVAFYDGTDTIVRVRNLVNNEHFIFEFDREPGMLYFDPNQDIVLKQATTLLSVPQFNTGTDERLIAFPNPAREQVSFFSEVGFEMDAKFKCYDATGNQVFQLAHLSGNKLTINLKEWKSGIYEADLIGKNTKTSCRFIVVK